MSRWAVAAAGLTGVYALALGSVALLDLALGGLAAAGVLGLVAGWVATEPGPPAGDLARRAVAFVPFAVVVLAAVARDTWDTFLRVCRLRPIGGEIVSVPIGGRTQLGVAVSMIALTLSPGTVLVDVDDEHRLMVVHVIHADDVESFVAEQQRLYERWQRAVFP